MKIKDIIEPLDLSVKAGEKFLEKEIAGGYAGDLLSDVLANSKKDDIWVTMQTHLNIVAVAIAKAISAIIIVNNRIPDEDTLKKAEEEKIPILVSTLSTYKVVCKLNELGVK